MDTRCTRWCGNYMSEIEDLQIELENALKEIEQLKCPIFPIVISGGDIYVDMMAPGWKDAVNQWYEQFDRDIDEYDDDGVHKFVKLYLARMIKDDSK